jgi:S-DNA-T family DNA segregation ATPase FtsK/SpoIIIE
MDHLVDLGVSAVDWYEQIWPRLRTRAYLLAGAFWLAAGILLLSLGTVLLGSFGDGVEAATVGLFGLAAYAAPLLLGWYGVQEVRGRSLPLLVISSDLACGLAASLMLGATLDQGGAVGNAAGRLASTMLGGWYGAAFIAACMVAMALSARWGFGPRSSSVPTARAKAAKGLKAVDTTTLFQAPAAPAAAVPSSVCISELVHASTAPSEAVTPVTSVPPVRATKGLRIVPKRTSLPSLDLLEASERPSSLRDRADEEAVTKKLEEVLADHNIVAKVEDLFQGPQVTTYEVSIAAGTKVSRVLGLAEEVSFALGRKVRALVSLVNAGRIAFEIPNTTRQAVCLKSLLTANSGTLPGNEEVLPLALGLDVRGKVVTADLAAMPHILLAGATGSGKSVGLHALLLSILFRRTPAEVRFIMIDPKAVELSVYNGISHMLRDIVTDAVEAAIALTEAVNEMERRYALLSAAGAKNIGTFNKRVPQAERLPRIVIVIDEFGDLVIAQGKDKSIETAIQRLGQKARACGLHLVLATQRPSVDVITGVIKSNLPCRIAFRTAQAIDSRVVLDEVGAEALLGKGDALVQLGNGSDMRRVQFPNVTEGEVERVVAFLHG